MKKLFILLSALFFPQRYWIYRDYFSGDHTPYTNVIHDGHDKEIGQASLLSPLFKEAEISDGDEFVIIIFKTGGRPFGDTRWILQEAHHYGPESLRQTQERLEKKRDAR